MGKEFTFETFRSVGEVTETVTFVGEIEDFKQLQEAGAFERKTAKDDLASTTVAIDIDTSHLVKELDKRLKEHERDTINLAERLQCRISELSGDVLNVRNQFEEKEENSIVNSDSVGKPGDVIVNSNTGEVYHG